MIHRSWAAASLAQSSVTASAGVSCPPAITSASSRNRPASARQACLPSSLSSGTRSSYPGMPYMVAVNGFSSSQRRCSRSARSRTELMQPSAMGHDRLLDSRGPAPPKLRRRHQAPGEQRDQRTPAAPGPAGIPLATISPGYSPAHQRHPWPSGAMTLAQGLTAIIVFWAIVGGIGASLLLPAMQSLIHGNFEGAAQRQ